MNRYERRVRRGAAHLDSVAADWPWHRYAYWINRIDVGKLDVDDPRHCVIGQLTLNFHTSVESTHSNLWLVRRGFLVPGLGMFGGLMGRRGSIAFDDRKARLTQAWRDYIIQERVRQRAEVH